MRPRSAVGYTLGFLGVAWLFLTLAVHVLLDLRGGPELSAHLTYLSLAVGAVVGWWGFYWAIPRQAVRGGDWMLTAAERIERIHTHRRSTDPAIPVPPAKEKP